ncbi:MAG: mechanosensitive ion channel protein MscS [Gemmatimonadetes bacterium]|nr:mechanosensitive ion channel protein MscS [Gemmatimonadota bacterium]
MIVPAPVADVLNRQFLGNSVEAWLTAALTAAVMFFVLILARRVLVSRIGALAERTTNQIDDVIVAMLAETRTWVCLTIAILTGASALHLGRVQPFVAPVSKLVLLWQLAVWGAAAISYWMKHHLSNRTQESDRTSVAMISAMGVGAKVLLWVLAIITALKSVFAIEITPLITGLGVSGIAVALAVQNILGDVLAALAIVFDKPFDVGDNIGVDQITGVVEHIGLKTTRLRSVTGEQIIIGNGDLLKSRLRNFRRMYQRRVLFNLDIPYDTPTDVLARLPKIVEEIVSAQSPVKFDRSHVASFGESAIRLETVYFVLDPDYKKYMDIQQAINLEVLRRFAGESVQFALPSRTVYHQGPMAKELAVGAQPQAQS